METVLGGQLKAHRFHLEAMSNSCEGGKREGKGGSTQRVIASVPVMRLKKLKVLESLIETDAQQVQLTACPVH